MSCRHTHTQMYLMNKQWIPFKYQKSILPRKQYKKIWVPCFFIKSVLVLLLYMWRTDFVHVLYMQRVEVSYTFHLTVDSMVFKDDKSETEAKTNSAPHVCALFIGDRLIECKVHTHTFTVTQSPSLALSPSLLPSPSLSLYPSLPPFLSLKNCQKYVLKRFWVIFLKIPRIFSENFEKYFEKNRKLFQKFLKITSSENFRKYFSKFGKFWEIFLEVSRNITEIYENYIEKFKKKNSENFENYFITFRETFRKVPRNTTDIFKK